VRGALHGIPVLVKDNIDTADRMATSAGSVALAGRIAANDAHLVRRMRDAGAVLLGKTNLSEWANFRARRSVSGWSSRGGQTRNPHALDRSPGGSSSGSAVGVASGFCTVAVGTETDGSIVSPSAMNGVVGIKPTVGLVSRAGIVPIAHSQDTGGAIGRSVADAACLLAAISGPDPADPETLAGQQRPPSDYGACCDPGGLRGARIGVARNYAGFHVGVDRVFDEALDALREAGAALIDGLELTPAEAIRDAEFEVLLSEFRVDLDHYLERLAPPVTVHSLSDLVAFNASHRDTVMPYFGQDLFEQALGKGPLDGEAYRAARAASLELTRDQGIDRLLREHRLDAIVTPSTCAAWLIDWVNGDNRSGGSACPPAVAGYPNITVPAGFVAGLPIGLSFCASAFSEAHLIRFAYAFEQLTRIRRAPTFAPHADTPLPGT